MLPPVGSRAEERAAIRMFRRASEAGLCEESTLTTAARSWRRGTRKYSEQGGLRKSEPRVTYASLDIENCPAEQEAESYNYNGRREARQLARLEQSAHFEVMR